MKRFLRRLLRRPAIWLVNIYSNYLFRMGIEAAEARHRAEGSMIYLASQTFHPDRLVTYDKARFKTEKRVFGVAAQLLTMNTLKSQCYYHTADRFGNDGLSADEVERRRKAFLRERLRYAGLI